MVVYVAIFTTGCEREAIWREVNGVYGSEMAMDLCQILVKYHTLQSDLEATGALVRQGDITRVLTTRHEHVELLPLLRVM